MIDEHEAATVAEGEPRESVRRLERGSALGRYLVLEPLGDGAMGVVYRAFDPELDRLVAIKLLATVSGADPDHAAPSAEILRLQREAQVLARLAHPNVVAVHDVGRAGRDVYIAMELVEGVTLRAWLAEHPRSLAEILRVFKQAGDGLCAAHAAGIVHRDFKPDNVLVGRDGRVRVVDFGIARAAAEASVTPGAEPDQRKVSTGDGPEDLARDQSDHTSYASQRSTQQSLIKSSLTVAGAVSGTPRYMAPEQARGEVGDARTDQFSFAVVLYEALYGNVPYGSASRGDMARAPFDAGAGRLRIPQRVKRVLSRALGTRPEERFGSLEALLEALSHDPWARARTWAPLAVACLIAMAAFGANRKAQQELTQRCQGASMHFASVWNAPRRTSVMLAFARTNLSYAKTGAQAVSQELDAYGRTWVADRTEACAATFVRQEQSEATMDLRVACLDRRLVELRAHVDALIHADARSVERVVTAGQSLPDVTACRDVEALRASAALPSDPKKRARIKQVQSDLARARASVVAARFGEARRTAEAGLAASRSLGFRPLTAEAGYSFGEAMRWLAEHDVAANALEAAARDALATRQDDLLVLAWTSLIYVRGQGQGHFDEARQVASDAEAAWERAGRKPTLLFELRRAQSVAAFREGRFEEARAYAEQAAKTAENAFAPDDPRLGAALIELANAVAMANRIDDAAKLYGRARVILEGKFGTNHPKIATIENNLGNLSTMRGRHEEALIHFKRAREVWFAAFGRKHQLVATATFNVGSALANLRRDQEAVIALRESREEYVSVTGPDNDEVALADAMIADSLLRLGHEDEALALYQASLTVFERHKHPDMAYALIGLALVLEKRGSRADAIPLLRRAVAVREESVGKGHPLAAVPVSALGLLLVKTGSTQEGLTLLEAAHQTLEAHGEQPMERADAAFRLAEGLALAKRDEARARTLAQASEVAFRDAGANTELTRVSAFLARY